MKDHELQHESAPTASRRFGNTADMDRLARVVDDMQHLEWELAKRAGKREDRPVNNPEGVL